MTTAFAVPASLEEIIQRFDAREEPFNEFSVSGELNAARGALVEPTDAESLGAWAEVLAFALATDRHENPWNSYFGPMGSGVKADGAKVYFPDISDTPPEAVAHWSARARALKHPFLKARYADLTWEMSGPIGQRKRDPEDARIAIDSYLDAIPRMAEEHELLQFAIRALDLAVLIWDAERTERARTALMNVHRGLMKTHSGMWWYAVDRLLEDKRAGVTDAERAELIADLENIVVNGANTGDPAHFNPHEAQSAAERLIPYYNRLRKFEDARRLHKAVGESFEHFASNADPMLAAALLQTATDEYRNAGLKEERDRTRILMQKKIGAAGENLQSIEHKIEITKDDMEKFLDLVVVDDIGESFVRIAREFMLKRKDLEDQVQKTLEEAPLMAHITQMIYADDRVAARIGGVDEDSFGRLFHQAKFAFQFERPWLVQAFQRLFEKHGVVPQHFAGWANRHGLFDDMSLLVEGTSAWAREDNVKAAHVLIPQIERALRKIADGLGIPVTKAHPTVPGTSVAIGMGEILYNAKVAEALGPDATLHFQTLYSDPRGMNLRNEIAHGLMDADQFHWHLGNLIVHSLLMLGLWKEFGQIGKKREAGNADLGHPNTSSVL
jgi:lysyl-tRNA synthetase class 1